MKIYFRHWIPPSAPFNKMDLAQAGLNNMIQDTAAEIAEMIPEEAERLRQAGHSDMADKLEEFAEICDDISGER
jgi:hypothetical protein